MIRMRMTTGDNHHQEEEEEPTQQVQQDKGRTMRDGVRARVKVKVQLVVLRGKVVMAMAWRIG
jgi:hypothetical protein